MRKEVEFNVLKKPTDEPLDEVEANFLRRLER